MPDTCVTALCGLLDLFGVHPDQENALEWELLQALSAMSDDDLLIIQALIDLTRTGLKHYVSLEALAAQFKVKPKVIRALVHGGALPAATRKGQLVFDQADIDRWLSTHTFRGAGLHAKRVP